MHSMDHLGILTQTNQLENTSLREPGMCSWQPRRVGWGGRRRGFQEGGDTYIPVADSC